MTGTYHSVPPVMVRPEFQAELGKVVPLGLANGTKKARSEFIIAPILAEFWRMTEKHIGLHSGVGFPVEPESALGEICCDFLITRPPVQLFVKAPIIMIIVEAETEDLKRGFPQCIAEMLAAQRFNEREGTGSGKVYGAVTVGNLWQFLEMEGASVRIDAGEYHIENLGKTLGILMHMAG